MAHDHSHPLNGHGHGHAPANFDRAFAIGIVLNTAFVLVEVGYGLAAQSLALLADAGHNMSDVLGLMLSWSAVWLGRRPATSRFTYGFRRSSILASLLNAVILLVAVGMISWEAIQRLSSPQHAVASTVIVVAAVGIVVNGATALLFARGSRSDLNVRAAFTHMLADAAITAGVVGAGFVTLYTGWVWIDPVVSLVIGALIVVGTWGLLTESLRLSLDGVPRSVDHPAVCAYLTALPGVTHVHDLHIWSMSTTEVALTAHLVRPGAALDDGFSRAVAHDLDHRFGIAHSTIQIEQAPHDHGCQAPVVSASAPKPLPSPSPCHKAA